MKVAPVNVVLNKPIKSARKAKGDGHLRRAEILHAAEGIFLTEGYEGATIRKIADAVGVSSTALYMHFPDKAAILLEICEGAIARQLAANTEIAARPTDPATRVRLMMQAYMRFALENPNAYLLVYCTPPSDVLADKVDELVEMGARSYAAFESVVGEIAAAGRLRTGTVNSAAQALWATCHGVVSLLIAKPAFEWAPTEDLMAVAVDGVFHGLVID